MPTKATTHQSADDDPERKADRERQRRQRRGSRPYDRAKWKRLRKMVLARDPLCVECETQGRVEASTHVDHITALCEGGTDHMGNLQGLCASCHNRKTAMQDGGFGR
ncbi:hypothetical protein LCGC14_1098270 [marine sediment metagenome]|uniref:HNH nuclease domain-containing protein n=1 Tax=marine sediment metagenome TaxID=412755 RepID=A0A0F9QGD2_9ZZZZ